MPKYCLLSLFVLCLVLLSAAPALPAVPGASDMYILSMKIKNISISNWLPRIANYTIGILWFTSLIAFAIGCKDLALSGGGLQLEGIVALVVRFAFLTGMMFWLLSNQKMFFLIPDSIEHLGGYISTGTPQWLSFTSISTAFVGILTPIIDFYRTLNWTSPGLLLVCLILVFFINCLAVLFITTVLLVRIETMFIVIGGMFTAAFFVIGYFRDLFMGYIKALAMNGIKLLLLSLCLSLLTDLIADWKGYYTIIDDPAIIYDTVIPMTFALMAFYIVIKSVPQYAVAILTGHATADGGLAKAAVTAGIGAAATVWNVSRGISQTAVNTVAATHNAAESYNNAVSPVKDSIRKDLGGSLSNMSPSQRNELLKARGAGTWEAVKTFMSSPIGGRSSNRSGESAAGRISNGNGNEIKPGDTANFEEKYKNKEGIQQ